MDHAVYLRCQFNVVPTASLAIMAKTLGISVPLILTTLAILYITVDRLLSQNREPALLTGYPGHNEIAANLSLLSNSSSPLFKPPLSTRGRNIVGSDDVRFKLASMNWYGASDELFIPGGLDVQHRQEIALTIRRLGFNSVRLPYADEMVRKNPLIAPHLLAANADLVGLRALDVFHAVVESLTSAGLAVIVNNHITRARWCCDGNLCDGKWSNSNLGPFCSVSQTENDWIENWVTIMQPHVDNLLVVGADLRNEVRGLWGRLMWNEWVEAAERAAERLHHLQPNWLMIVEGVSSANDISGATSRPVELIVPNKLVYSAHVYGWSGWGQLSPYWKREYNSFAADMRLNWAYLLEENVAPVWVGEFGAPAEPNTGDLHYWQSLMRFLRETEADFGYWAINPRKPKDNEVESYSLVHDDWKTPRCDYRIHDIMSLGQKQRDMPGIQTGENAELIFEPVMSPEQKSWWAHQRANRCFLLLCTLGLHGEYADMAMNNNTKFKEMP